MKYTKISIIFLLICFNLIFADKTLVLLSEAGIEEDTATVITFAERNIIAEVDSKDLNSIKKSLLKILDEHIEGNHYYLICSKDPAKSGLKNDTGNLIYHTPKISLLKNPQAAQLKDLNYSGYDISNLEDLRLSKLRKLQKVIEPANSRLKNEAISNILAEVNADSIKSYIQMLQDMGTRYLHAPNRRDVALQIKDKFIELGCDYAEVDSFYLDQYSYWDGTFFEGTWQYNVVATITGNSNPDTFIILGGHHDSIVGNVEGTEGMDPYTLAPGADDNGSAVAAAMEACRLIKCSGYTPDFTLKFITFAGEEHGLLGSKAYAQKIAAENQQVRMMINNDMIATSSKNRDEWYVRVRPYSGCELASNISYNVTSDYTSLIPYYGYMNSSSSDSYSFFSAGYQTTYFAENEFSPYYHSYNDIIENCNIPYCSEVVKASLGTMIYADQTPFPPQELQLTNKGNGNEIIARWKPNQEAGEITYLLKFGTDENNLDRETTTSDTIITIANLTPNSNYFVQCQAVKNGTQEGYGTVSSVATTTVPTSIEETYAAPDFQKINLHWAPSKDYDFLGYNIYRGEEAAGDFMLINSSLISDTTFTDESTGSGIYYSYFVTAIDDSNMESLPVDTVRARAATLDGGILIVDESADGSGDLLKPTDEEVDNFYGDLTADFSHDTIDLKDSDGLDISEMGYYSTIIWHGHKISNGAVHEAYRNVLAKYLDIGGNLLLNINRPSSFEQRTGSINSFSEGDFLYNYLKVDSTFYESKGRISGAVSLNSNFNNLEINPDKTPADYNHNIKKMEKIHPLGNAVEIMKFSSDFEAGTEEGFLKDGLCGVYYDGDDFKTALITLPFYFCKDESVKENVKYILHNIFNEPLGIDDAGQTSALPHTPTLHQNYPNPFNPKTTIAYGLPAGFKGKVNLSIYNQKGEKVSEIVNKSEGAGLHRVTFDGSRFVSGVYFYKLKTDLGIVKKKMILVK